ncbi:hypothetical protein CXB51_028836 [Gossypium anomalum]|uniref:Uncharacterized protein n=1 Tax=Gossypium anomalum TaxID=47600 RepID=A0A8J6CT37_9ROSI|nr:hypothetical protein CXB51_028836 [Gossypium anomalum]
MAHVSDIKLIRTDTTLDLSQKAEKARFFSNQLLASRLFVLAVWDLHNIVSATSLQVASETKAERLSLYRRFLSKQLKLPSCESLAKCPIRRSHVIGGDKAAIACCDPKRECLAIHFWPQLRDITCQPVLEPLMETDTTSPAPPTLVINTRLKYECPFMVNLMPPDFLQATLQIK